MLPTNPYNLTTTDKYHSKILDEDIDVTEKWQVAWKQWTRMEVFLKYKDIITDCLNSQKYTKLEKEEAEAFITWTPESVMGPGLSFYPELIDEIIIKLKQKL